MSRLRLEGLRCRDRGPFDLLVEPGECVTITGPSGAGKTMLLRAIADLDPHEGRTWLDDDECRAVPAPLWRRRIAMLPAESAWWEDSVGAHFADGGARLDGGLFERVGLGREVLDWPVTRLSSGERQRLALVRLLAGEPVALLLDEPTASLDGDNVARVERLVAAYRTDANAPVVWVCHDPDQAGRVGRRCFELCDGHLTERVA